MMRNVRQCYLILLGLCWFLINIQCSVGAKHTSKYHNQALPTIVAEELRTSVSNDPHVLNVHIVPHTHDDVGWLKTADQYYYGLNNTIANACVRRILTSVVYALQENPKRKFTFVEMAFFTMWWKEQNKETQKIVKKLVAQNRLSFANGGWCMHDEATTHFVGMIDQTTLGHSFLKEVFDFTPTVGWQLDPFGHSATQASLLTSDAGFNAVYMGRIDFMDRKKRIENRNCEGVWQSSKSLPHNKVFWGLTGNYGGNDYGPPKGFCFDPKCLKDEPIVENFNVDRRVNEFIEKVSWQGERTRGNNIMLTFGSDFHYENAPSNFFMIDKLIRYVNEYDAKGLLNSTILGRFRSVNVLYSTPEMYTMAKYSEKKRWDVKFDDFLPYSHKNQSFWSGYYTSRPALKRLERVGSSFLQFARQIQAMDNDSQITSSDSTTASNTWSMEKSNLFNLDSSVSILQHHDGITGTSKQHVAYDYAKRVDNGMKDAINFVERTLKSLLGTSIDLSYCQHLNLTVCEISQRLSEGQDDKDLYVVVFNPIGKTRDEIFSIPVSTDATYKVYQITDDGDQKLESALLPSKNPTNSDEGAKYTLFVEAKNIPAIGAIILRVQMTMTPSALHPSIARICSSEEDRTKTKVENDVFVLSTGLLNATFNIKSGALKHIRSGDIDIDISQEWGFYRSFKWSNQMKKTKRTKQNSGAYFFRPMLPNEELNILEYHCTSVRVFDSPIVSEVYVEYSTWVKQIIRLKRGAPFVEVDFTVGPIPVDDGIGKEVVVRYKSSVQNSGVFYTDSNGREFQKRVRGFRETWDYIENEPVAGNYYPVTAATYIQDSNSSFGIMNDRAQGGSSLRDGQLELMVHRRTLADDNAGVNEPLDETDQGISPYPPYGNTQRKGKGIIIRGTHHLVVGGTNGAQWVRPEMERLFAPTQLFFGKGPSRLPPIKTTLFEKTSLSALQRDLPPNIMLVTLLKRNLKNSSESFYLVRLGHLYSVEEGPLSAPARVDLSNLFSSFKVKFVEELTLTGTKRREDWISEKLLWNEKLHSSSISKSNNVVMNGDMSVEISPMEIRSFALLTDNNIPNTEKGLAGATKANMEKSHEKLFFGLFFVVFVAMMGLAMFYYSRKQKHVSHLSSNPRTKKEYTTVEGRII